MAEALADLPYEVVSLADYPDAPEVEETGSTFVENAVLKATAYAEFTGELTLADDSGLEVDALDGAPGVLSSRFAPTDPERNSKLLDMMKDVPDGERTARFRCVVAIAEPDGASRLARERRGNIAREPRAQMASATTPSSTSPTSASTWPSSRQPRRTRSRIGEGAGTGEERCWLRLSGSNTGPARSFLPLAVMIATRLLCHVRYSSPVITRCKMLTSKPYGR